MNLVAREMEFLQGGEGAQELREGGETVLGKRKNSELREPHEFEREAPQFVHRQIKLADEIKSANFNRDLHCEGIIQSFKVKITISCKNVT